ncbi:MAG: class I SAM-dependent methyltransferase [Gallionella sp.]|nr:class I SAM-dependent methyltransferase [Gallionella sp.]
MKHIQLHYESIETCPLCGAAGVDRAKLSRQSYYFGPYSISLPDSGVFLRECTSCSLLYKNAVPNRMDLAKIMSGGATDVWRPKSGPHPALDWILPYLDARPKCILDIGASNGDLLAQLKPYASCVSALDVVAYPQCQSIVSKEYIIGEIEGDLAWSGEKYEIVTAFDIFEHFLDTHSALNNIGALVAEGGKLIVETGDWNSCEGELGEWYYANLFEHQIFWNRQSIDFLCGKYGFKLVDYRNCSHKGRRGLGFIKRSAMELVVNLAKFAWFQQAMLAVGKGDPLRFASPALVDHAFFVLEKSRA